jgi:cytochrome bd-type quinol oxidase subunit 2
MPKKKEQKSEEERLIKDKTSPDTQPILPLIGEILAFSTVGIIIFTIFLTIKLVSVIQWSFWWVCSPLWLILFSLLVLTQSRKLTTKAPLIVRLAWLLCVTCVIAFLILLNMKLELEYDTSIFYMFLPLWALLGITVFLGISGIAVSCCTSNDNPDRKKKYLFAGLPLLVFDAVFFPFLLLLELKLNDTTDEFSWSVVFIPLWITDGFFLCVALFLLLFTIGSRQDALFSLSQVITFISLLPVAAVFKILVVLHLDGDTLSMFIVMTPILVVELLLLSCGLNIRLNKRAAEDPQHTELNGPPKQSNE